MLRTIGLMSGTSLDGVDAAYLETDGEVIGRLGPRLTLPYDPALRRMLRGLLDRAEGLAADDPDLLDATRRLTERHAEAVEALGLEADLIGFHGQTILHRRQLPGGTWPITWQIEMPPAGAEDCVRWPMIPLGMWPPAGRGRRWCRCSTARWPRRCRSRWPS